MNTLTIQLRGTPTQVTPERFLEILAAERRVEICRELKRLKLQVGAGAAGMRAALERELAELGQVPA